MIVTGLRAAAFGALVALAPPLFAQVPTIGQDVPSSLSPSARGAAIAVDAFHAALRRGDTKVAAGLLASDALIFEGGGVERSKVEYEAHHLAADAAFSRAVPTALTRRSGNVAGGLAWIASEGRTTGTYKGKPVDRVTAETMVLRRSGRGWIIVHIHWSSAAKR